MTRIDTRYSDGSRKQSVNSKIHIMIISAAVVSGACSSEGQSTTTTLSTSTTTSTSQPPIVTTTERATTTTLLSAGDMTDIQVLSAVSAMQSTERGTFIEAIESNFVLERVDVFSVDVADGTTTSPGTVTLRVEGSSGYQTDDNQINQVWELASTLALFWDATDGLFRNDEGTVKVSLAIVVDGRRYSAPYEVMVQLADRLISRADWLAQSRR